MTLREQVKLNCINPSWRLAPVRRTPAEARDELVRLRRGVMDLAAHKGLKIAAAGTHPFSSWKDQEITPPSLHKGVRCI